MRQSTMISIGASLLLTSGTAFARPAATPTTEPTSITVGTGTRTFNASSARGSFVALHVIPAGPADDLIKHLKTHAVDFAMLAGVRHVILVGGPSETFTAVLAGAPPLIQDAIYHDADGSADRSLNVSSQCKAKSADPCHAIILLDERGNEVHRTVDALASSHAAFEALAKKVADLTRDKQITEANLDHGLAMQGYDPVSYIDDQRATVGDRRFESTYRGITYRFATSAHRDTFNSGPSKYIPAYGGWCATAMAKGDKVEIDPGNFKVTGGRLFLFYKGLFGNALNDWKVDEKGLTVKADDHWKKLTSDK